MSDLVAFLNARLDEDVRRANGASAQRIRDAVNRSPACYSDDILFLARYDPARVLAEVAVKRLIVAEHADLTVWNDDETSGGERIKVPDWRCRRCVDTAARQPWTDVDLFDAPCQTLRILASVYADHADYDPSWKPDTADGTIRATGT